MAHLLRHPSAALLGRLPVGVLLGRSLQGGAGKDQAGRAGRGAPARGGAGSARAAPCSSWHARPRRTPARRLVAMVGHRRQAQQHSSPSLAAFSSTPPPPPPPPPHPPRLPPSPATPTSTPLSSDCCTTSRSCFQGRAAQIKAGKRRPEAVRPHSARTGAAGRRAQQGSPAGTRASPGGAEAAQPPARQQLPCQQRPWSVPTRAAGSRLLGWLVSPRPSAFPALR